MHSWHRSLDIQVPPAADNRSTITSADPPTEPSHPGFSQPPTRQPMQSHVAFRTPQPPGVHTSGFRDISHGAHLMVPNVCFYLFFCLLQEYKSCPPPQRVPTSHGLSEPPPDQWTAPQMVSASTLNLSLTLAPISESIYHRNQNDPFRIQTQWFQTLQ